MEPPHEKGFTLLHATNCIPNAHFQILRDIRANYDRLAISDVYQQMGSDKIRGDPHPTGYAPNPAAKIASALAKMEHMQYKFKHVVIPCGNGTRRGDLDYRVAC